MNPKKSERVSTYTHAYWLFIALVHEMSHHQLLSWFIPENSDPFPSESSWILWPWAYGICHFCHHFKTQNLPSFHAMVHKHDPLPDPRHPGTLHRAAAIGVKPPIAARARAIIDQHDKSWHGTPEQYGNPQKDIDYLKKHSGTPGKIKYIARSATLRHLFGGC